MTIETTLTEAPPEADEGGGARQSIALVLLWSQEEPQRVGEVLSLPLARGVVFSIGRAAGLAEDGSLPLLFRRLRPISAEITGPFTAPHVSRQQLRVAMVGEDRIEVELTGRGVMRVRGEETGRATVAVGELIEVVGRFVLLVSRRPLEWPQARAEGASFAFGEADPDGIVGESPAIWRLRARLAFLRRREEHVLVYGPSGVGKELVVRALHRGSRREDQPLIARDAATLPEGLIDAELFGNVANYPSVGAPERRGLVGEADGGTLFLDEIGELSHGLQAHLLRVLDQGEYQRLGEGLTRRTDVRLICATNRDPSVVKHDLLARLIHKVAVPGFEARVEDVVLLARHLARGFAAEDPALARRLLAGGGPRLSARFVLALACHDPRRIRASWRRCCGVRSRRGRARRRRCSTRLRASSRASRRRGRRRRRSRRRQAVDPKELTRAEIVAALERSGGVRELAWRDLGLRSRDQLKRLMKKFGIG
ncbi:MAG: sigma 54-interacting transcriptional regulator [Nannocystis sp.]|nr:sigma 54-interacting transcriptional regulator [Nannocystis sp.]